MTNTETTVNEPDPTETEEARLAHEQQADDFERAVTETEDDLVAVWAAGDVWVMRRR